MSSPAPRTVDELLAELDTLRAQLRERDLALARVNELREANQNLVLATVAAETQREQAEATNRRQNEFLAMLAHELRNPLAPISMGATLMERLDNVPPELRQLQAVIRRQVDQMARLLDDLLDAARISGGKINLSLAPLELAEVIAQAVETIAPRLDERRQQLHVQLPGYPLVVNGDKVRLTQVFCNLLHNASRYSPDGSTIRIAAGASAGKVELTVEDEGVGMTPDVIEHIFELFSQGPRTLARSEGGLGIGLNVVRNLVQRHGGVVEAHSEGLGRGSCFTVTLPQHAGVAPGASLDAVSRLARPARPLRVLVVEDNADANDTLAALLRLEGHDVACARDGTAGLELALATAPDALVCDIGLPGLDGYALMTRLRREPATEGMLALALSGYGQPEDRSRALQAGFNHFLIKPCDPARLAALLSSSTPVN